MQLFNGQPTGLQCIVRISCSYICSIMSTELTACTLLLLSINRYIQISFYFFSYIIHGTFVQILFFDDTVQEDAFNVMTSHWCSMFHYTCKILNFTVRQKLPSLTGCVLYCETMKGLNPGVISKVG